MNVMLFTNIYQEEIKNKKNSKKSFLLRNFLYFWIYKKTKQTNSVKNFINIENLQSIYNRIDENDYRRKIFQS